MTHTYAILELSKSAVDEIRQKLTDAGYDHAFHGDYVIDMHRIAVSYAPADRHSWFYVYQNSSVKCSACGIQRLGDLWRKTRDALDGWRADEFPACTSESAP